MYDTQQAGDGTGDRADQAGDGPSRDASPGIWRHLVAPTPEAAVAAATRAVLLGVRDRLAAGADRVTVGLTGGGAGSAITRALGDVADAPWDRVDLWYGDERWVRVDDPERNDAVARDVLRRHPDGIGRARLHPAPQPAAGSNDPDVAARALAADLPDRFDVLVLGVGPDGHVASLFPDRAWAVDPAADAFAVRDSPKPPPVRLTVSMAMIRRSRRVVLVAVGAAKAAAVRGVLAGDPALPAMHATGVESTLLVSTA